MGFSSKSTDLAPLLSSSTHPYNEVPGDSYNLAFILYFIMGTSALLPSKAFTTAIDYFSYTYPGVNVNRIFTSVDMLAFLISMIVIVGWAHRSSARTRINLGLVLCIVALSTVPIMDLVYLRGRVGLYLGFYLSIAMDAVCGCGLALIESGVVGSAGELPHRYTQATASGMATSGLLVAVLRIVTKALYPHDANGLRTSASLYFCIGIIVLIICLVCYNISNRLPIIKYYNDMKLQAKEEEVKYKDSIGKSAWRSDLWDIVGRVKWVGLARAFVFVVSNSIFPGHLTEDVHSSILKDWYPILLITCFSFFNLVGMSLPSVYLIEKENIAIAASIARLLFYPLFLVCMRGPDFFQTEVPVATLTCLFGLTHGYVQSTLMILAPKAVPIQHSEMAGIVCVLLASLGLNVGSLASWLWVI